VLENETDSPYTPRMSSADPGPRRDPWWLLLLGLLVLIFLLWALLERTNAPEPGGVREGRAGGPGYGSDCAARRASSRTGAG
jgi:hypothetical protein